MALNIHRLILIDGLATSINKQDIIYKEVILRETTVADERKAAEGSERAVRLPDGTWRLLSSDDLYAQHMALQSIVAFKASGVEDLDQHVLDIDMLGKLSVYDMQAIQNRMLLIESAAQLRHGLITEQQFSDLQQGILSEDDEPPSPERQAEELEHADSQSVAAVERITPESRASDESPPAGDGSRY